MTSVNSLKSIATNIIKVVLAVGLIYWLIKGGKLDLVSLKSVLTNQLSFACYLLVGLNVLVLNERWKILLKTGVADFSRSVIFKLTCMGLFFNYAMPGGVGGDIIKGFYLSKNNVEKRAQVIVSLLMDRLIGLYCMIGLAVFVMLIDLTHVGQIQTLKFILISMGTIFIGMTVFFVFALSQRLKQHCLNFIDRFANWPLVPTVRKVFSTVSQYSQHQGVILKAGLLSLAGQTLAIFIFVITAKILGFDNLSLSIFWIVLPIGFIVTALPITPGGVGVGQTAFHYLFETYAPGTGVIGTTGVTVMQILYFGFGLLGAYFFVRSGKHFSFDQLNSESLA